jgi:hypothetical protein
VKEKPGDGDISWCAETVMTEAKDMLKSRGVNRESVEPELRMKREYDAKFTMNSVPHSEKILHNEFINGFRGVRHVHLALSISEISLFWVSETPEWRLPRPTFSMM